MSTIRDRLKAAEARLHLAEQCLFDRAVDETLLARQFAKKYGEYSDATRVSRAEARGYIAGLYFIDADPTSEVHEQIKARVEAAADERSHAEGESCSGSNSG